MDLDDRVDQVAPEPAPRRVVLQARRQPFGDHVPVEEAHHVERDAEHATRPRRRRRSAAAGSRAARARAAAAPRGPCRAPRGEAAAEAGGAGRARVARSSRNEKFEPPPSPIRRAGAGRRRGRGRRGTPRPARARGGAPAPLAGRLGGGRDDVGGVGHAAIVPRPGPATGQRYAIGAAAVQIAPDGLVRACDEWPAGGG